MIPSFIAFCLFKADNLDTQNYGPLNCNVNDSDNSMSYSMEEIKEDNLLLDQLNRSSKLFGHESSELTYFGSLVLVMRSKVKLLCIF